MNMKTSASADAVAASSITGTETAQFVMAENVFGRYAIPQGLEKRPAAKSVLRAKVHEPKTIAFMQKHCRNGDIIHAGTFFGDFLPALSSTMAKGATVWAFEPSPENFAAAQETAKVNKLGNVKLANGALSDGDGALFFRTHDKNGNAIGGVSHIVDEDGPGVQKVEALMLDYVIPRDRNVTVLQLDVEGHEKQALWGAYHLIARCQPILILEYMDDTRWIRRHFGRFGYKHVGQVHGNHVYATPDKLTKMKSGAA